MKKIGIVVASMILLIVPIYLVGSAGAGNSSDAGDCPSLARIILKVIKIDLSRAQKRSIARILLAHQPEFQVSMGRIHQARQALAEALLAPKPDQDKVKAAYTRMAVAGEKLALLAARVLPRLRAVLTPKQVKILEGVRPDVEKRIKCRMVARRALVQRWLAVHAK